MKIIFLHCSRCYKQPFKTNLLPIGLLGLADFLNQNNHQVEILHNELEIMLDQNFNIIDYIKKKEVDCICLDLHYHYQSYEVIKISKNIKNLFPNIKIILGGLMTSLFAEEIMNLFNHIDFTISGDSELPLLELVNNLNSPKQFNSIPNLTYRLNNQIFKNQNNFIINTELYNKIRYTNYGLLKNHQHYLRMRLSSGQLASEARSYFSYGRSCNKNCSFCGASANIESKYKNHQTTIWKETDSIIQDLENLKKYNVTSWCNGFCPDSNSFVHQKLYEEIRRKNIKIKYILECFELPNLETVINIKQSFDENSVIILSPFSGSKKVRQKNNLGNYSNKDFINCLCNITNQELGCSVYFTAGLAYENKSNINQTKRLILKIKNKFPQIQIYTQIIEFEPKSNYQTLKNQSGIRNFPRTFIDYYNLTKKGKEFSYDTKYFTYPEIKKLIKEINKLL